MYGLALIFCRAGIFHENGPAAARMKKLRSVHKASGAYEGEVRTYGKSVGSETVFVLNMAKHTQKPAAERTRAVLLAVRRALLAGQVSDGRTGFLLF